MTLPTEKNHIETVEKFQSLQSGQYWRATSPAQPGIETGMVLLIQSIKWVDNKAHTIVVRPHPSKINKYVENTKEQDEDGWSRHILLKEHKFLLRDFLSNFEFEPDFKEIRAAEFKAIQDRMNDTQNEIIESQRNPALLNEYIEKNLKSTSEGTNLTAIPTEQASQVISNGVMAAIGTGITESGLQSITMAADRQLQIAKLTSQWMQNKTKSIAEISKEMLPYFEEHAAAAIASSEDVQEYVVKVKQGVESLTLYTGKDVEIVTIAEGKSADKDIPLTLVQKKLIVDEELALYLDVDEWFDFTSIKLFDEALRKYPALVNQIFPTERCVLVMATTRRYIDYGSPMANAMMRGKNQSVFMMVRDGENIYRVYSPIESHLGSSRLFPSKNDQDSIFRGVDGSTISFEDIGYTDALSSHELHALHYKRFLILICGLDHRLKLFGEFYDGPPTLNFISMSFQEKYCRFLHDDDGEGLLANPDKRQSLHSWMEDRNKLVKSGSRMFGRWSRLSHFENIPAIYSKSTDTDGNRLRLYNIKCDDGVKIASASGPDLYVDVSVGGSSWSLGKERNFKAKLKILQEDLRNSSNYNILCLDDVDLDDIEYYINHRGSRSDHISYIRFFKRVRDFIKAELKAEAPTREFLLKALNDANIGQPEARSSIVNRSIAAWRAENRGQPLPTIGNVNAKSFKALLDHMYAIDNIETINVEAIINTLKSAGLDPLRIAVDGNSNLVAYAKLRPEQVDVVLEENPFVNRVKIDKVKKGGFKIKSESLVIIPNNSASEKAVFTSEDINQYLDKKSIFGSNLIKQRILEKIGGSRTALQQFAGPMDQSTWDGLFKEFFTEYKNVSYRVGKITRPETYIPIGAMYYAVGDKDVINLIYLKQESHVLLYFSAPNEESRKKLRNAYIEVYSNKSSGAEKFDSTVAINPKDLWNVVSTIQYGKDPKKSVSEDYTKSDHHYSHTDFINAVRGNEIYHGTVRYYIHPSLFDENGKFFLDNLLNIKHPDGWELFNVKLVSYDNKGLKYSQAFVADYQYKKDDEGDSFWYSMTWNRHMLKHLRSVDEKAKKDMFHFNSNYKIVTSRSDLIELLKNNNLDPDNGMQVEICGAPMTYYNTQLDGRSTSHVEE